MSLYRDGAPMMDTDELLSLPPAQWLLQDFVPKEGFVSIYGLPASGKSFVALDWAMCISQGKPWLGKHKVARAPVIYVAAEGGRGVQQRVRAWQQYYKAHRSLPGMYWLLNPLYVREEGVVEEFLEELDKRDIWPGLIVLDTLSRSFGGGEENASADMGHFVDRMTYLAGERRMAALVVHHSNATGQRERGNSALRGGVDALFRCVGDHDKVTNRLSMVTVDNIKQKDAVEVEPVYLRPEYIGPSLVLLETTAPQRTPARGGGPAVMRKSDMLNVLGVSPDGLTWGEWRIACGIPQSSFHRRVRQLMTDGLVYKDNGKFYVTPATKDLAELGRQDD